MKRLTSLINVSFSYTPSANHRPYPDYISREVGVKWKDCIFHEPADGKNYWYDDCCEAGFRIEEGTNKHLKDLK